MIRPAALLMIALLIPAGAALAQDQPHVSPEALKQIRAACSADVKNLCDGLQPGGGRILQCMRTHKTELSPDCQSALAQVAAQLKARAGTSTTAPNAQ